MPSQDHRRLMQHLKKFVQQERWQKMPKGSGKVLQKNVTKSGNVKLIIQGKKKETTCYVLKKNSTLYAAAEEVKNGDVVSVALRRYLGKMYCVKLAKKEKISEKETKLTEFGHGPPV